MARGNYRRPVSSFCRVPITLRAGHPGGVDAKIMVLERRKDGRLYPLGGVLPVQERARAIRLAHRLVHADGMSIRQCQAAMLQDYGLRRSRGIIQRDLVAFACPVCDPAAFDD